MQNKIINDLEAELRDYLWKYIPISRAMGVQVSKACTDKIILRAPFSNNINHKNTVFGGSLHAVATLCCWSLLHVNLAIFLGKKVQIVISHSQLDYLHPVSNDFEAECVMPDQQSWEYFLKTLARKSKARLNLQAKIFQEGKLCVDYRGIFVAIA